MGAPGRTGVYELEDAAAPRSRTAARLSALVAIGLIAASGGLLSEVNRLADARADAQPAALALVAAQG